MARRPRLFGSKLYHHIYAWGNNRQAIFINDQHYARYLSFLEKYSKDYLVDIIAYALMHAHVHLFVHDLHGRVSDFMNNLHGEYAQYFNRVTGRIGHVFGERFNNKVVQANEYGLWLSRYIHRQAVEAGLVVHPEEYPWCSYCAYVGETPLGFLKPGVILSQFGNEQERIIRYKGFVEGNENGPIDWDTKSIIVIGDKDFQREMQEKESTVDCNDLSDRDIFHLIGEHFGANPELLSGARGYAEKRLRHKIIVYLTREVGLKSVRISKLCQISRAAVLKAVNKEV